ncbi:MAG: hypothetical protein DDT38_01136 [Firmicutes bacterium]|nr:hypothetical protein [candidate division NPL-UPA2 bacterium]
MLDMSSTQQLTFDANDGGKWCASAYIIRNNIVFGGATLTQTIDTWIKFFHEYNSAAVLPSLIGHEPGEQQAR